MRIPVTLEHPLGVGDSKVFEMKEGVGEIFSDQLYKSRKEIRPAKRKGGPKKLLVNKLIVLFSSNSFMTPTLTKISGERY
jgi:hypothetical protein